MKTKHYHHLVAPVLSAILPGAGQLYNHQWVKGFIMFLASGFAVTYFASALRQAIWGIATLGDAPSRLVEVDGKSVNIPGDHSINLMIQSLIVLFLLALYIILCIQAARDAYSTGKRRNAGLSPSTFRQTLTYLHDFKFAQLLLVLPAAGILFLTILPIVFMILLAFTNYSSPHHIPPGNLVDWTGFETFVQLFRLSSWSGTFLGVLGWTVLWAVVATATTFASGLAVALVLSQKEVRLKGIWRTLIIIPYAIPQMISLLAMKMMFNGKFGPINQYLSHFGLGELPWLTDPFWAKLTVIIVNMWVGMPLSFLLVSSVLSTIPPDLYEAAKVEGAGRWQQARIITLPFIMFAIAPIIIIQLAGNFNNFNVIYLLTNGGPSNPEYQFAGHTDLLITWLYKLTLNNNIYNIASAIGIILFIIIAAFSIWNYRQTRSFKDEEMTQ
ncbi:ABC transporter permease subunit [Paenibacillus oenotherae]|uniref:Maltose/maltodextrin transport system permease protein n=1 Tax=Paenibacillus oenotherae TaxID=1435645 RepID=A0ABS7DAE2_9BACL|nr:sugar ABC transporter permease [Paenibacillus oenotherae]MBW7476846.1 ABC transporter permease subunit [Paenibacillus oenotherae]